MRDGQDLALEDASNVIFGDGEESGQTGDSIGPTVEAGDLAVTNSLCVVDFTVVSDETFSGSDGGSTFSLIIVSALSGELVPSGSIVLCLLSDGMIGEAEEFAETDTISDLGSGSDRLSSERAWGGVLGGAVELVDLCALPLEAGGVFGRSDIADESFESAEPPELGLSGFLCPFLLFFFLLLGFGASEVLESFERFSGAWSLFNGFSALVASEDAKPLAALLLDCVSLGREVLLIGSATVADFVTFSRF